MATRSCLKRLAQDFKLLSENPLVGVNAAPLDDNILVWHINFDLELQTANGTKHAILHAILEAPKDYPNSPPNVGFCIPFRYTWGASYVTRDDGPLKGTQVLCLNILGNFAKIHTEWKSREGEGWSPSMSVETVLVQLQSLLSELDAKYSDDDKKEFLLKCQNYKCRAGDNLHTYEKPWPPLISQEQADHQRKIKKVQKIFPKELRDQAGDFLQTLSRKQTSQFEDLIRAFANTAISETGQTDVACKEEEVEDDTIRCYVSRQHFSEAMLGYGIYADRKSLKSPGDLLSMSAFINDGVRFSSTKIQFTHWLPAFINQKHASYTNWRYEVLNRLKLLKQSLPNPGGKEIDPVLDVLPNLINSMIVEIMKGDRAAAIAFFEALCSFWRTLRYFLFEDKDSQKYRRRALQKMKKFCTTREGRHKDKCPDVGQILALYTCLTDKITETTFVDAYSSESTLRGVMWWKDGAPARFRSKYVFEQRKVSRNLFMFQMTVCRVLIQGNPTETCKELDRSCGRLPERLELLQKKWKEVEPSIATWKSYFQFVGCSPEWAVPKLQNIEKWISDLIDTSSRMGPKYQKMKRGGGRSYNGGSRRQRGGRRRQNYL